MRYSKGDFLLTPNKAHLKGMEPTLQILFIWLSEHSDDSNTSFPSRQTLAAECGISVKSLDRAMQKLIDLGMVKKKARYNGGEQTTNLYHVIIKAPGSVKLSRGSVKLTPGRDKNDIQNSPHLTHPIEYIDTKVSMGAKAPRACGKPEINELMDFWALTMETPIQGNVSGNRKACYVLYQTSGMDGAKRLIQTAARAQGQPFAPEISDFIDLNFKLKKLTNWEKRNAPTPPVNVGALLHPNKYKTAPASDFSRALADKLGVAV